MDAKTMICALSCLLVLTLYHQAQAENSNCSDVFSSFAPRDDPANTGQGEAAAISALRGALLKRKSEPPINSSDLVDILSALGQLEWSVKEPDQAIRHLTDALALRDSAGERKSPGLITDLASLADAYGSIGEYQLAIETIKRLIPLLAPKDPTLQTHLFNLANWYANSDRNAQAEALYDQVFRNYLTPTAQRITSYQFNEMLRISRYYRVRHQFAKSQTCIEKLIALCTSVNSANKLMPVDSAASKEKAERALLVCLFEQRQYKKAQALFRKYPPQIDIDEASFYFTFGDASAGGGFFQLPRAAGSDPGGDEYKLGSHCLKMHRFRQAEQHFKQGAKSSSTFFKNAGLIGLVKCYQMSGNKENLYRTLTDYLLGTHA